MLHVPGFKPREISTLLNRSVIEQHAEDAAALSRIHARAVNAPLYRLRDLALLDERILAHLEGLRTSGTVALTLARRGLALEDPGAIFVVGYLAFSQQDAEAIRRVVLAAASNHRFMEALLDGISWVGFSEIEQTVPLLARSDKPEYRRLAVSVLAAHRVQSDQWFRTMAVDADATVRARTFRAIGETKFRALEPLLRESYRASEPAGRFWASWSMGLFGDTQAAAEAYQTGIGHPELSAFGLESAMRAGEPSWARELIRLLVQDDATIRRGIVAAGFFGDPGVVPWLIQLIEQPVYARVAAEAVAMITGVDLEAAELKQDAPDDAPEPHEEDGDLRWPSLRGFTNWWKREQHRFPPGHRFLAGFPLSELGALEVLRNGYQRQRRGAAIELARLREDAIVFPVAARADWQRRRLGL